VPSASYAEIVPARNRIANGADSEPTNLLQGQLNYKPEARVVTISGGGGPLNSKALRTFHPGPERFDTRPKSCEDSAHAALDARAGRTLTRAQWAVAQAKLLEFVTILRAWDQKTTNSESGFGNV
jgi:hypothetical protein